MEAKSLASNKLFAFTSLLRLLENRYSLNSTGDGIGCSILSQSLSIENNFEKINNSARQEYF
jgi:hypothetical protein